MLPYCYCHVEFVCGCAALTPLPRGIPAVALSPPATWNTNNATWNSPPSPAKTLPLAFCCMRSRVGKSTMHDTESKKFQIPNPNHPNQNLQYSCRRSPYSYSFQWRGNKQCSFAITCRDFDWSGVVLATHISLELVACSSIRCRRRRRRRRRAAAAIATAVSIDRAPTLANQV